MAETPARLRSGKLSAQRYRRPALTAEEKRQRKTTANKVLTMLKAALNHAFTEEKIADDSAWRRVKPFRDVDAPRVRYLTEAEALRLTNACDGDFQHLIKAALLTGARYGELCRMVCADFNPDIGTVHIRESKAGKSRDIVLTDEAQAFFEAQTAGRAGNDRVFLRSDGRPWGKSHQKRRLEEACERARISPAISFHILRHCAGSWLAQRGVPMSVIASQLGHADERMAERHYAHLEPSYVKDTIRQNFPTLGFTEASNVTPLPAKR